MSRLTDFTAHPRPRGRERALALITLGMLLAVGCRRPLEVELDVPASVGFVALIDTAGRGTPMTPFGGELSAFFGDEPTWALGYDSSTFDGFAIDGKNLELAAGCDARLPAPSWVGKFADGELEQPPGAPPDVTVAWYQHTCPRLDPARLSVDVDCTKDRCRPRLDELEPCHYRVDLADCELFAFEAWRHPDGSTCMELPRTPWTCEDRPAPPSSAGSFSCVSERATCGLDVYVAPPAPGFRIERFTIGPSSRFLPDWFEYQNLLRPEMLALGTAHDFVSVGDEILAATTEVPMLTCAPVRDRLSILHRISPTGEVSTATAPPCLSRLAYDRGLVGTFLHEGAWAFGRLSTGGAVERATPFDASVDLDVVTELLRVDTLWLVLVARSLGPGKIYSFDAQTLEAGPVVTLPNGVWSACALGGSRLALAVDRSRTVDMYEWPSPEPFESLTLPRRLGSDFDSVLGLACHDPHFWVSTTKRPHLVTGKVGDSQLATPVIFDSTDDPVWPLWLSDSELWVSSTGNSSGSWTASLYRFDAKRGRFLPGSAPVGHGILTRLKSDTSGRVVGLLPWANELVRITTE